MPSDIHSELLILSVIGIFFRMFAFIHASFFRRVLHAECLKLLLSVCYPVSTSNKIVRWRIKQCKVTITQIYFEQKSSSAAYSIDFNRYWHSTSHSCHNATNSMNTTNVNRDNFVGMGEFIWSRAIICTLLPFQHLLGSDHFQREVVGD